MVQGPGFFQPLSAPQAANLVAPVVITADQTASGNALERETRG